MEEEKLLLPRKISSGWITVGHILLGAAVSGSVFVGTTNAALASVGKSMTDMTMKVDALTTQVNALNTAIARIDEHLKEIDRRVEILEGVGSVRTR
jgi:outer membrane murein-binding lipoprotein Lpp